MSAATSHGRNNMSLVRKRTQPYIYPITPFELTLEDKNWLAIALKKDYHKTSIDTILKDAVNGHMQLWRFQEGIIVSELLAFSGNKFLVLTHMAGRGFIKNLDTIEKAMTNYCKANACIAFEVATAQPALQRLFAKRFKEITKVYAKEIN